MTLQVRSVGPEGGADVLAVVRAAFAGRPVLDPPADALGEDETSIAQRLEGRGGLLAVLEGRPVGALILDPAGETLFLRRFGVVPDVQGHGVAGALIRAALDGARGFARVAVLAREELPDTIAFWVRQGFERTGGQAPYVELARPLPVVYEASTAEEMRALGARLAGELVAGDLVVLTGELGAGKTTFTQGLGEGLGVRGGVTSPTFVISRVHPSTHGGPDLVHVDAYRLGGAAELDDLDLDTSLDGAVTVVEWGAGLAESLAESRLDVRIIRSSTPEGDLDPRRVEVLPVGPRWAGVATPRRLSLD